MSNNDIAPKEAFMTFLREFVQESDRAAVVLGSAKLESLLGEAIKKRLTPAPGKKDDLVDRGPLSSFRSTDSGRAAAGID